MAKLLIILILALIIAPIFIQSAPIIRNIRQSEDETDDDGEDDIDNPDAILLALDFETKLNLATIVSQDRSKGNIRALLLRTLAMLDNRPNDQHELRRPHNQTAKALGRILSGNPRFGSNSNMTCTRKQSSVNSDPEYYKYCENRTSTSQLSIVSMKKILDMKEKGRSHAAIKKLYPRYQRDRLDYYRKSVEQRRTDCFEDQNVQ